MAASQVTLSRHHRMPVHIPKSRPAVPAFLQKLHEMVNDPDNHELIRWSAAGDSFFVLDHERFAREVLGRWFKHQNFASFVRQLNMYGFHKIPHLQQGVLRSDADTDFWNFAHPNFHRGRPELLCLIQRKKQTAQPGEENAIDMRDFSSPQPTNTVSAQVDMQTIINGISAIQRHQSTITSELNELKRSNQLLWQDAMETRARHQKQQDTINRIVKFLAGVFGQRTNPNKEDAIDSIQTRAVVPLKPTRFALMDHLLPLNEDPQLVKHWRTVDDIDGDVEGINLDIDSIVRSLGLENEKDAAGTLDPIVSVNRPSVINTSLQPNGFPEMDTARLENSPESSRPSPSDSMFDIDSLFGFQDNSSK